MEFVIRSLNLDFFYPLVFFGVVQKLLDRFFQDRMDEVSIDFGQRDEDELAILDPGMGDPEFFGVDFNIVEEKDVQINRPGSPPKSSGTP